MDFSKLCRCCMKNGEFNVFTTLFESKVIAVLMNEFVIPKISEKDNLPKTICQKCYDMIVSYHSFVTRYKEVQVLLQNYEKSSIKLDRKCDFNVEEPDSELDFDFTEDEDQPLSRICKKSPNEETKCYQSNSRSPNDSINNFQNYEQCDIQKLNGVDEYKGNNVNNNECKVMRKYKKCSVLERGTLSKQKQKKLCEKEQKKIDKKRTHTECPNNGQNQTIKIHSCTECSQSFNFIKHLERHCKESGHVFPRRFICPICSKKFLSNTRLNDHMRIHNNERPYKCSECSVTFTLSSNLKRHKKKHTGEKSYFCEICGRGFIQKHTLAVHMRLHNGETPFVCELCGKGYRAKPLLHQHMYIHKDAKIQTIKYQKYYLKYGKMKVECSICKKIITKSALYNHMKIQHGDGMKKFLCNLCGKTYTTKMSLDVHMNVHTKKISYNCIICSKSFTHQNYLKTHIMLHSGERPHCCDLCGKTFVQRTHLDRHMRTHTGVKPYTCTYCDKSFALNENLKVHMRIHTGETPHHCSICGKGFFDSSSKKKHETSVHQMHRN